MHDREIPYVYFMSSRLVFTVLVSRGSCHICAYTCCVSIALHEDVWMINKLANLFLCEITVRARAVRRHACESV
jgi:hypothetical protein